MPVKYDWPKSDEEANQRALEFKERDPFPSIPRALLSSAEISDYVRVTGMLHPFCKERLNSASYEAHLGQSFIMWDQSGKRIERTIKRGDSCKLPANSIAFVQIEPKFRLPHYIALRFNLRITHVHRGLLLGTGPLIDPGFEGDLLIPLHNLTFSDYEIDTNEALIWIEFTKTTYCFRPNEEEAADPRVHREFPPEKMNKPPEYYLHKASGGNPIRSSIGGVIQESREKADKAEASAKRIEKIGWFALFVVAVSFASILIATHSLINDSHERAGSIMQEFGALQAENEMIRRQVEELTNGIHAFSTDRNSLDGRTGEINEELRELREQIDARGSSDTDIAERLEKLERELQSLTSSGAERQAND